jgi:hypothetical protein
MKGSKSNSVDHWFQRTVDSLLVAGKAPRTAEDVRRYYLYRLLDCGLCTISVPCAPNIS